MLVLTAYLANTIFVFDALDPKQTKDINLRVSAHRR